MQDLIWYFPVYHCCKKPLMYFLISAAWPKLAISPDCWLQRQTGLERSISRIAENLLNFMFISSFSSSIFLAVDTLLYWLVLGQEPGQRFHSNNLSDGNDLRRVIPMPYQWFVSRPTSEFGLISPGPVVNIPPPISHGTTSPEQPVGLCWTLVMAAINIRR